MSERFGVYLKTHRKAKGVTQDELAGAAGVKQSHISHIEQGGHKPSNSTINTAIALLNLDRYEAYWMAGKLPPEVESVLLEAEPREWRWLMKKYGAELRAQVEEG